MASSAHPTSSSTSRTLFPQPPLFSPAAAAAAPADSSSSSSASSSVSPAAPFAPLPSRSILVMGSRFPVLPEPEAEEAEPGAVEASHLPPAPAAAAAVAALSPAPYPAAAAGPYDVPRPPATLEELLKNRAPDVSIATVVAAFYRAQPYPAEAAAAPAQELHPAAAAAGPYVPPLPASLDELISYSVGTRKLLSDLNYIEESVRAFGFSSRGMTRERIESMQDDFRAVAQPFERLEKSSVALLAASRDPHSKVLVERELQKVKDLIVRLEQQLTVDLPVMCTLSDKVNELFREFNEIQEPRGKYQDDERAEGVEQTPLLKSLQARLQQLTVDPRFPACRVAEVATLSTRIFDALEEVEHAAPYRAERQAEIQRRRAEAQKGELELLCKEVVRLIVVVQCVPAAEQLGIKTQLQEAFAKLPLDLQGKIYGKIWELAGKPAAPDFGKLHVFDDLQRLEQAVFSLSPEEFSRSSTEELLHILQTQLLPLIDNPRAAAQREANLKITHKLLGFLPAELRGKIEGALWKLAGSPQGDPHWGRNHILDNATLLHEAIDTVILGERRAEEDAPYAPPGYRPVLESKREKKEERKEEKKRPISDDEGSPSARRGAGAGYEPPERKGSFPAAAAAAAAARPAINTGNAALDALLLRQPGKLKATLRNLEAFKGEQVNYALDEQESNDAVVTILEGNARDPGLGLDICGFFYGKVWEAAGKPQSQDPDFGKHNVFKQLDALIRSMYRALEDAGEVEY